MLPALMSTNYFLRKQKNFTRGKVRDVYEVGNDHVIIVTSDRISAFDHVLPRAIPYKGQVLNQIAARFLDDVKHIVPTWLLDTPDPNVSAGIKCKPFKVEMVIRGYLSGHAWREYKEGKRTICGITMPAGMNENDKFPEPIITPSSKADTGHDVDYSTQQILDEGLMTASQLEEILDYTRKIFEYGTKAVAARELILVDTKYEFGEKDGKIYLLDEIHTPDSSRYFYSKGYQERQEKGEPQKQLSKEFVREWLMANGFQGLDGQLVPNMTDEFVSSVSERYIELYENLTGQTFERADYSDISDRIETNINLYLDKIGI